MINTNSKEPKTANKTDTPFTVFHIPHDGTQFPEELMASVCIPRDLFQAYHEKMRDKDVTQLIPNDYQREEMVCFFPVSRLLCDVERFIGPHEIMEQFGMGFCYEKAFDGRIIKHVTDEQKVLSRAYYDRHHDQINHLCNPHKNILFLDLHSYSTDIIPDIFLQPNRPLPDLCIGTDERFTPPRLTHIVRQTFQKAGLTVTENYPYRGCYIPEAVMNGEYRGSFRTIMLEFHRRAYLNEQGDLIPEKITAIRDAMNSFLDFEQHEPYDNASLKIQDVHRNE